MKLILAVGALALLQLAYANPVKRDCNGCTDDGVNYAVNDTWYRNCNYYECIGDDAINRTTNFCVDPNHPGDCRIFGEVWSYIHIAGDFGYCVTYTCSQAPNPTPSNLKCRYGDHCFAHGETVSAQSCIDLTCVINGTSVDYTQSDTPNCTGECFFTSTNETHLAGDTWSYDCYTYTCTGPNTWTYARECCTIIVGGETRHYDVGPFQIAELPCNWYYCDENGDRLDLLNCYSWLTDSCVAVGTTVMDGCFNYTCVDKGSYGNLDYIAGGCYDSTISGCRSVDETWTTYASNSHPHESTGYCYHKRCTETLTETNSLLYQTITEDTQCSLNGECYDRGVVRDYDTAMCKKVYCDYTATGVTTYFDEICRDSNGVCHECGTNGWPLVIGGNTYSNCTCNKPGSVIQYQCY